MRYQSLRAYVPLFALSTFLGASAARAVDGVTAINQARALAGGVTPGDTPGFPVTITASGSYRLTSNLTVSDPNLDAIDITAPGVTLDLNGFEIVGPVICTTNNALFVSSCTPSGTASGIRVTAGRARIWHGTVRGFALDGVLMTAADSPSTMDHLFVTSNGLSGIETSGMALVLDSTVFQNGASGIVAPNRVSVIQRCVVTGNGGSGILTGFPAVIVGNAASFNGGPGISAEAFSVVRDNVASTNQGAGIVGAESVVDHNTANDNHGDGIDAGFGSLVSDNSANSNQGAGINADHGSSVLRNTTLGNSVDGLSLVPTSAGAPPAAYRANVMNANGILPVANGVNLGVNDCDGTICP